MKVEQLRQLIVIIQQGSINKAAQELYISQSALSASIRNLEAELGNTVIERTSKGISLTPYGTVVYHQAIMICAEIDFLHTLSGNQELSNLNLDISHVYNPIANETFIQLYNTYSDTSARFSIRECSTLESIANVQSGISEVGIITLFSNTRSMYLRSILLYQLEYHKLTDRQVYIVIGKNHPLFYSEKETITLEELDDYAFAFYKDLITESSLRHLFAGQNRKKADISLSTMESLLNLVSNTTAFTLEVYNPTYQALVPYQKDLRFIPLKFPKLSWELGWICNQNKPLSPLAKEYIKALETNIKTAFLQKIEKDSYEKEVI